MQCEVTEPTCADGHVIRHTWDQADSVFFLSPNLGMGEELFWDFHGLYNYGRLSFSKFCTHMTAVYKSTNPNSAPFVSNHTFLDLFFSWIVRMGIDFRLEVDPWCGHDPEVLACDGTHIGVSVKLQRLTDPITKPELEEELQAIHKLHGRCFLPYPIYDRNVFSSVEEFNLAKRAVRRARDYLYFIICRTLEHAGDDDFDDEFQLGESDLNDSDHQNLVAALDSFGYEGIKQFMVKFIENALPQQVKVQAARTLKLVTKRDYAVSNLLPFGYHPQLKECLDAVETSSPGFERKIQGIRNCAQEVADLLLDATATDTVLEVVNFIRALLQFVEDVHSQDRETADPVPIPGTYDPPSGTAYYFTEHGQKLREMPHYKVSDSANETYRAAPCNKKYPQVSSGGWGYMFLFFCPIHGHCYGFHLVDGAEGRKDPFSALYKYKPHAPKDIFYDFACQLNEYCLNREPAFFKWMRVWHDLFHGCNHICVPCFKSTRVLGLKHINSEICEQFNSYLQSIKYTGSHLSQTNFMLFSQFMVFAWNREKTRRFKQLVSVAVRGLE